MIDQTDLPEPDGVSASSARRRLAAMPFMCLGYGCHATVEQAGFCPSCEATRPGDCTSECTPTIHRGDCPQAIAIREAIHG